MSKPFDTKELLARITVQLRKAEGGGKAEALPVSDLRLDPVSQNVTVQGQTVRLTRTEFAMWRKKHYRPALPISRVLAR